MTNISFFLILTTGFFTGLSHCVGMCGPLVSAFALRRRSARQEVSTPLILFQIGRLTTYSALGAILGDLGLLAVQSATPLLEMCGYTQHTTAPATSATGSSQLFTAILQSWQGGISVTLGLLLTFMGLSLLGVLPIRQWFEFARWGRLVGSWLRRGLTSPHPATPFALGLVNGLLPCGAVYAAGLLAAASGDAVKGATTMLVFGLGTLPAMLAVGFSASWLSWRWRHALYRLAAMLVMVVGVQLLLRGLAISGHVPHAMVGGVMLW
jgi:hypothetical protein